jgi:hypothetical protein
MRTPGARRAGVDVDRQPVGAVSRGVILGDRPAGQLAVLADEQEVGAEPLGQRGGDDEASGLDSGDEVGRCGHQGRETLDRRGETARIEQQGGDVAKLDPGPWEIRDGADQRL